MDLPAWVGEYTLQRATPAESRLLIALFLYGRPVVGQDGERRVYLRGSNERLALAAKMTERSVITARAELARDGVLKVHRATRNNAGGSISAPVDRPDWGTLDEEELNDFFRGENASPPGGLRGENASPLELLGVKPVSPPQTQGGEMISPPSRFKSPHHDDDLQISPDPLEVGGSSSSSPFVARELVDRLGELGITDPDAFLRRFGAEHCRRALELYDEAAERAQVRNPAGLIHHFVTAKTPAFSSPQANDGFEARLRRYAGGAYAHIVRTK